MPTSDRRADGEKQTNTSCTAVPWLLPFRTLVRFKIFQLAGVGAASAPLSAALNNDPMSMTTCGAVAAVVGGSAACFAGATVLRQPVRPAS